MIEVYPNLYIGSWIDYEKVVSGQPGWAVVHACKEYHRITVGYKLWNVTQASSRILACAQRKQNNALLARFARFAVYQEGNDRSNT